MEKKFPMNLITPAVHRTMKQSDFKRLQGQYKSFFRQEHCELVERWYNLRTTLSQRHDFKKLVHLILSFDVQSAKAKLRTTFDPDIISANVLVHSNNGHLLSDAAMTKCVEWLSFATVVEKNRFRCTFGMIIAPKMFSARTSNDEDFNLQKRYWKVATSTGTCRVLQATNLITMPSEAHTAPSQSINKHPSSNGQHFVWKVQPRNAQTPSQRAHESSVKGTPWGSQGPDANKSQWLPVTMEAFSNTFFNAGRDQLSSAQLVSRGTPRSIIPTLERQNNNMALLQGHLHGQSIELETPNKTNLGTTLGIAQPKTKRPMSSGSVLEEVRFQNYNENFARKMYHDLVKDGVVCPRSGGTIRPTTSSAYKR